MNAFAVNHVMWLIYARSAGMMLGQLSSAASASSGIGGSNGNSAANVHGFQKRR